MEKDDAIFKVVNTSAVIDVAVRFEGNNDSLGKVYAQ